MSSLDECGFSLEKHSCVSGSRPVEFHYHYVTTRTACGLHAVRDVLHIEFPQDVTVWAAIGFDVFLLLKVSEHAGRYSFSGVGGVVALVVHARARMA